MNIKTESAFLAALGTFSNYPKVFICADGGILCECCAQKEKSIILENIALRSVANGAAGDWLVIGVQLQEEPTDEDCDNCGEPIYPSDEPANETEEG